MWVIATIAVVGLLSWAAYQDRAQINAALQDELDTFLERLLS